MSRVTLQGAGQPPVRYYLSKPAPKKAPLVLFIQGSGCIPPFTGLDTPNRTSSLYSWLPLAHQGRYAVMAVDKPYQSDEPQQGEGGSAIGCAGAFNQHFSYDSWLATLKQALRHALKRPEVDATRVLVFGLSEGGPMAAGLAREHSRSDPRRPRRLERADAAVRLRRQDLPLAGCGRTETDTAAGARRQVQCDQRRSEEHQQIRLGPYLPALEQLLRPVTGRQPGALEGADLPGERHAGHHGADPVDRDDVRPAA